ncbi:outer membrane protein assembly factor BamC [Pigmentiphaga soli]|uniref:Outer membrane protein assembly factor BamC n=1 Tax=Pigmentiphaga soli TaxID=1007095 RepID=A0ABP8GZV4_9BURK
MNAVRSNLPRLALLPVLVSLSALFAGCSSVNQLLGKEESIDYKSATSAPVQKLEVPPDLTQLPNDTRYQVPGAPSGTASAAAGAGGTSGTTTFSSYAAAKPEEQRPASASNVLPTRPDMRVERSGNQRWLVVDNRSPEQLYPLVRQFWQDNGFLIREEDQQAGVMETDWAENRAKIPQDFLRRTIGRVFDSAWDTGERDMFRTRLERTDKGTEIYISHRGAVEELVGADKTQTAWTSRPNDPGLEAEFLSRLMVRLGSDADRAKTMVAQATPEPASGAPTQLVTGSGDSGELMIGESFDRAWRRVGLALDRGGFTVEDRNRAEGVYYVRYVDVDSDANNSKPGFLSRLFGRGKPENSPQYRVKLSTAGEQTRVTVLDAQGNPERSQTGRRILNVLSNQLK